MITTKCCSRCHTNLSINAFSKRTKSLDGRQHVCRECASISGAANRKSRYARDPEYDRNAKRMWYVQHPLLLSPTERQARSKVSGDWAKQNKPHVNARLKIWRQTPAGRETVSHGTLMSRFSRHGLTLDQYHAIVEKQDFRCAICGVVPEDNYGGSHDGFHIDHHHVTRRVRGLLCQHCNVGIGMLKDSPEVCTAAAGYLLRS